MKKAIAFLLIVIFCCSYTVMADCLPVYKKSPVTTSVKFNEKDFLESFEKKGLSKIRFSILPMEYQGKLLFKGKAVKELQEIPLNKLKKLEFVPNKNYTGSVVFLWNGAENSKGFCESPSTVTLFITKESVPTDRTEKNKGFFQKIKKLFKI